MSARRLVVGDDGSAASDVVWLWVNSHRWPGWTISVVSAQPPEEFTILPPERTAPHPWTPPHPRVLFADSEATHVEHLTAEADPRVVLGYLEDASLVLIGPRGRGALKQLHIGSTAQWLLNRPSVPVAIIRSGHPTERVLLCTDGSIHARRAALALAELPWISEAAVTVLCVADGRIDAARAVADAADILRAAGAEPELRTIDIEGRGPLLRRDARSVILDELDAGDIDLVALGTSGQGGLRRMILGSTASAVALHAPCSVLVAYAGESD